MKKAISLLLIISFVWYDNVFAQKKPMSEEDIIKMALATSVIFDGSQIIYHETIDEYTESLKKHFDAFEFTQSPKIVFYKPNMPYDSIAGKYQIQLFKVQCYNSEYQHLYLMWYKDFRNKSWLRVGGYIENDLKLLFDYLRKQGMRKRHLKLMLNQWRASDPLFEELDWGCLFAGYLKNKTNTDCFLSVYYIDINGFSVGFDPLSPKELYSRFARSCPGGYLHVR